MINNTLQDFGKNIENNFNVDFQTSRKKLGNVEKNYSKFTNFRISKTVGAKINLSSNIHVLDHSVKFL